MPLALATVLEDDAHVSDFQLLQVGPRRLRLRLGLQTRERGDQVRNVLRGFLRVQGLSRVTIDLDELAPDRAVASGKLRRIVRARDERAAAPVH
jgi:hypothetical protein